MKFITFILSLTLYSSLAQAQGQCLSLFAFQNPLHQEATPLQTITSAIMRYPQNPPLIVLSATAQVFLGKLELSSLEKDIEPQELAPMTAAINQVHSQLKTPTPIPSINPHIIADNVNLVRFEMSLRYVLFMHSLLLSENITPIRPHEFEGSPQEYKDYLSKKFLKNRQPLLLAFGKIIENVLKENSSELGAIKRLLYQGNLKAHDEAFQQINRALANQLVEAAEKNIPEMKEKISFPQIRKELNVADLQILFEMGWDRELTRAKLLVASLLPVVGKKSY